MKNKLVKILLIAAAVVGVVIAINKTVEFLANLVCRLPIGNGDYYNWKNGDIYYTEKGVGDPILLIHDLNPTSSGIEWTFIQDKLAETHRVYTIDLLGCGRSDKPSITYTNFLYVQLVNDFIRNVIEEKTTVIATGESLSFTVMASAMEKDNFQKIIAVNPSDLFEMSKQPNKIDNIFKKLFELPVIGTTIYQLKTSKNQILDDFCCYYYENAHLASDDLINTYHYSAHKGGNKGKYLLSSMISHYTNINILHAIQGMKTELSIIGSADNAEMMDIIQEYVSYNKKIKVETLYDTNYLPQLEKPEEFVEIVRGLL